MSTALAALRRAGSWKRSRRWAAGLGEMDDQLAEITMDRAHRSRITLPTRGGPLLRWTRAFITETIVNESAGLDGVIISHKPSLLKKRSS